jgi:hypothetical protein
MRTNKSVVHRVVHPQIVTDLSDNDLTGVEARRFSQRLGSRCRFKDYREVSRIEMNRRCDGGV